MTWEQKSTLTKRLRVPRISHRGRYSARPAVQFTTLYLPGLEALLQATPRPCLAPRSLGSPKVSATCMGGDLHHSMYG